jgi:predicted dinucleotide-utilizing enzyme
MIEAGPSAIVEAASQQAARDNVPKVLSKNIDIVLMSVGALLDMNIESDRMELAKCTARKRGTDAS